MFCGSRQSASHPEGGAADVPADVLTAIADAAHAADSAPLSASRFPDTTATIAILSDQLPNLNAQQTQFAATHYVGSQKLLLGATRALRAINPNFVVLPTTWPCGNQRRRPASLPTG